MPDTLAWWHYAVGFGFAFLPRLFPQWIGIHHVSRALWRSAVPGTARNEDLPQIVGLFEAFLYPAAVLTGYPGFIAVWLGMKVAGSWGGWQKENGRVLFHIFLVGTALSLGYGAGAGVGMRLLATGEYLFPALAAGGVLILHGVTYAWARRLEAAGQPSRSRS